MTISFRTKADAKEVAAREDLSIAEKAEMIV
jgi:hypothetical protein